jgi:hypothetical protein
MKVFIVFMALLIINVSFLSYQGDLGRYVRCQAFLKAVAEECAAGASLYYDEDAYSDGQLRFKYEESRAYIEHILEKSTQEMPLPRDSELDYSVAFQDDHLGYEAESPEDIPSVTVELTAKTEDLFRLPFLAVTEVKRAARYELPQ